MALAIPHADGILKLNNPFAPSNFLLILIPLMPNLLLATLVLFVRFSISQMDVPPRQSYTMAIVALDERSAAGVTGIARSLSVRRFLLRLRVLF